MNMPTTYLIYLAASVCITFWVGRTLHYRGRVFLLRTFQGNEKVTDAVNDLLIVGFYLVNIAFVAIALKYGAKPSELSESIEFLATKIGVVLLVLSVMHFGNMLVFAAMIRRSRANRSQSRQYLATLPSTTKM